MSRQRRTGKPITVGMWIRAPKQKWHLLKETWRGRTSPRRREKLGTAYCRRKFSLSYPPGSMIVEAWFYLEARKGRPPKDQCCKNCDAAIRESEASDE
jgi:hypothetical protein